jgi:carbonic anhydrase
MRAERMPPVPDSKRFPIEAFEDVLAANGDHAAAYAGSDLTGRAARGLAIVTCIDSRIDPLSVVGMQPGDVKILRNAGARVTDDVQRTLLLAAYLLGVQRILIMPHTDCRMVGSSEVDIHASIRAEYGTDTRSIEFRTSDDVDVSLGLDVVRVRANPLLPPGTRVGGAVYDVHTGRLRPIEV